MSAPCLIAIALFGDVDVAVLPKLKDALMTTFQCSIVQVADRLPLPKGAYDASREQYASKAFRNALSAMKKPEWDRVLGITDVDLFAPSLNFVFGEADSQQRAAVMSTARLRGGDEERLVLTEAVHELGHTYGLGHCDDPHCVMWFSINLEQSKKKGWQFCPKHAAQLLELRSAR